MNLRRKVKKKRFFEFFYIVNGKGNLILKRKTRELLNQEKLLRHKNKEGDSKSFRISFFILFDNLITNIVKTNPIGYRYFRKYLTI
jgi:hypothetical protein